MTRDGRDVAASFASQDFGPGNPFEALSQWEQRMLRTHKAVARCRPGRVLTIQLIDLVVRDRPGVLESLCSFVGVDVDAGMVAWFDANVTAAGMHPDGGAATSTRTPAGASTGSTPRRASDSSQPASRSPTDLVAAGVPRSRLDLVAGHPRRGGLPASPPVWLHSGHN